MFGVTIALLTSYDQSDEPFRDSLPTRYWTAPRTAWQECAALS